MSHTRSRIRSIAAAAALACGQAFAPAAMAQSEASALSNLSAMPIASVIAGTAFAASAIATVPIALSAQGATLSVKAVESTARGTVYVLERASDGARVSVEVTGRVASVTAGAALTVSVIGAGVVLSAAGEVVCFLPNAAGRGLLFNERIS